MWHPGDSYLVVLRESTSVLAGEPLHYFGLSPLFFLQPRAPVKLQREPRVPLELQQVTQSSFRVVVVPPLELQWGRSSLVALCRLVLVYLH